MPSLRSLPWSRGIRFEKVVQNDDSPESSFESEPSEKESLDGAMADESFHYSAKANNYDWTIYFICFLNGLFFVFSAVMLLSTVNPSRERNHALKQVSAYCSRTWPKLIRNNC